MIVSGGISTHCAAAVAARPTRSAHPTRTVLVIIPIRPQLEDIGLTVQDLGYRVVTVLVNRDSGVTALVAPNTDLESSAARYGTSRAGFVRYLVYLPCFPEAGRDQLATFHSCKYRRLRARDLNLRRGQLVKAVGG